MSERWTWFVGGTDGHRARMLLAHGAGHNERALWTTSLDRARKYLHRHEAEETARRWGGVVVHLSEIERWRSPLLLALVSLAACLADPSLVESYPDVQIPPGAVLEVAVYEGPGVLLEVTCDAPWLAPWQPSPALPWPPCALFPGQVSIVGIASATNAPEGALGSCEIARPSGVDLVTVEIVP